MKAYHLEKARDPSDLPPWLFDEHERRSSGRSRFTSRSQDEYDQQPSPPPARGRGLRDIYDAASITPQSISSRSERAAPRSCADDAPTVSKATNRLKALRDAKRNANYGSGRANDDQDSRIGETRRQDIIEDRRSDDEPSDRRRLPRIGLPPAPGRPRRI